MNYKEFAEKVQEIFGIDFAQWYCEVFLKGASLCVEHLRSMRVKPQAYKELKKFLEPFIVAYESQIHVSPKLIMPPIAFTIEPRRKGGFLDVKIRRWHKGDGRESPCDSELLADKLEVTVEELGGKGLKKKVKAA